MRNSSQAAVTTADPMVPVPFTVRRAHRETRDSVTIDLVPPAGASASFSAGQFNMLSVYGIGEVPISISGDPTKPGVYTHTVRVVGAVSKAIASVKPGDVVGVRGPFGTTWAVEEAAGSDVVIMAGGVGMAPVRPALYALLANRDAYGKIVLLYGARSPEELLYKRELETWRGRFDVQVEIGVDAAAPGWKGHVGVVTTLLPLARFDPSSTVAMVVGPEIMMRFSLRSLREAGVGDSDILISMERNMKCAVGFCGHCQFGPYFVCKDGPVFRVSDVDHYMRVREV